MRNHSNKSNKNDDLNFSDLPEETSGTEEYRFQKRAFTNNLKKRRNLIVTIWVILIILAYIVVKILPPPDRLENVRPKTSQFNVDSNFKARDLRPLDNHSKRLFCRIMANKTSLSGCKTYTVSDVLDLAWAVAPLFSCREGGAEDRNIYNLHKDFINYLTSYGIPSITIEAIKKNSDQTYQIARPNMEPFEMQSYIHNCSYMTPNLINMALRKLKLPWEYLLWIDAHQFFQNPYWIFEAIIQAEKFATVQLFSFSVTLDPFNYTQIFRRGISFATYQPEFDGGQELEFGNAYVLRREIYEKMGYLIDECIAGDCDVFYAQTFYPKYKRINDDFYPSTRVREWIDNAIPFMNGSSGFVGGNLYHFFHQHGPFPTLELTRALEWLDYEKERDLKRDENFALYISNNIVASGLEEAFKNIARIYKYIFG